MCTALPACKPFFTRFLPSFLKESFGTPKASVNSSSGYNTSASDPRVDKDGNIELHSRPYVAPPPQAAFRGGKDGTRQMQQAHQKHARHPTGRLEAELDRSSSEDSEAGNSDVGIEVTREILQTSEPVNSLRSNFTGRRMARAGSRDELINRSMV